MLERFGPRGEIGERLSVLVGTALVAELCTAYSYTTFRTASGFFYLTFLANTLLPLTCARLLLGLSLRDLGLGMPRLERRDALVFLGLIAIATVVAFPLLGNESYLAAYEPRRAAAEGAFERGRQFALFVVSAMGPSDLLHRAFLLFGIERLLRGSESTRAIAAPLAILFTMSFEVLSHLPKPPTEAIALLFASPILSWAALRTRSVWLPFAAHLYIEVLFFVVVLA